MKSTWHSKSVVLCVIGVASATALAAPPRGGNAQQAANRQNASTGEGLDSLGDDQLMGELADRGLDSLLDRYFDIHNVPQAQRTGLRTMQALHDLNDPSKKLSNAERQRRARQVAEGITAALPNLKDPQRLVADANLLMDAGVVRDANLLEYWGQNPATQARLQPVVQAVYSMLGRASDEAAKQVQQLSSQLRNSSGNAAQRWEQMQNLADTAKYRQQMTAYYLALSLPKDKRGPVVDAALTYLKELDNNDSTVQPQVRLMMGKLNLVKGDYADGKQTFQTIWSVDKAIQPPPDVSQQYEARYFSLAGSVEEGKLADSKRGLDELIAWEKSAFGSDAEAMKKVTAAAEMMRYRIDLAEAALAKDSNTKKAAQAAAVQVLLNLSAQRPDLKPIIYQQLVERLPKDKPVGELDPLLLQGLMSKAANEANKPATDKSVDKEVLDRGLAAAKEVLARAEKRAPGITPQLADDAARLVPVAVEALGQKVEAANAYLDYAVKNAAVHPETSQAALDDAGRLTFALRKDNPDDPAVSELYDRFLPTAINRPFNKTALAFYYAQRLRLQNKPREALRFFQMVTPQDKNYASAQYFQLGALQDLLDQKLDPAERSRLTSDVVKLAEQARQAYAGATDEIGRARAAVATITEAKVMNTELKKPQQTLALLNGFDAAVKGLPDEKILITDALLTRVNAYMSLGQLKQSTDSLVALLNQTGGLQGAEYVRELLQRLDNDFDKAEASGDQSRMRDIARSEADLSGFLVQWAKSNPKKEIRDFTYSYMVFDARTKRLAGTLETDPNQRQALLHQALAAYQNLQQPPNVALYKATLDPKKIAAGAIDPTQPDPNVSLGVALTDYELKNYHGASQLLGELLNGGKLGGPTIVVQDAGGNDRKIQDNDLYWEATFKLYRSNAAQASSPEDSSLEGTKRGLKNLLVRGGIPAKWQDKFDSLRREIIPTFNVATLDNPATRSAATQPVSAR